ncbi:cupin domain-containing protein [Nocardia fluminea]|uniref:cupin domain-containing protein n=1 Tax=Nocardia fluminea TaxID=134984 RepID=UPI0033ED6248
MATPIEDLPIEVAQGEMQTRYIELGDMAVRHARVPAGTDFGPVLQGLPGDRCPSPHWGIVLEGSLRLEHADGTVETANAGEVYYWPAGHTATSAGGAVFLEVGPVAPMRQFHDHALRLFG